MIVFLSKNLPARNFPSHPQRSYFPSKNSPLPRSFSLAKNFRLLKEFITPYEFIVPQGVHRPRRKSSPVVCFVGDPPFRCFEAEAGTDVQKCQKRRSERNKIEKKVSRDLRGKPRQGSRSRVSSGVSDLQANGVICVTYILPGQVSERKHAPSVSVG